MEPQFDDEVYMLSPVHATHSGVNTMLSVEESEEFPLSTSQQGQLSGLRDAVNSRVTLVGFMFWNSDIEELSVRQGNRC
jgi:hypothetical protein